MPSRSSRKYLGLRDMFKNKDIQKGPEFFDHAAEQGYITLKEAAELSNYSPDYVGQLIRAGKIEGKQVYSNVAWVTTEESLRAYMQHKTAVGGNDKVQIVANSSSSNVIFTRTLYLIIGILIVLLLLFFYIMSVGVDRTLLTADEEDPIESFTYE